MIDTISAINARLVHLLLAAAALLGFALAYLVVIDVIGRSFFNHPVQGTPEIVSMSIVIICFLLAGYAVQSRSMIYTDVLVGLFGWRGPLVTALSSGILGAMFFGLIMWGTWEPLVHAITSGEYEGEGALRVPTWPARTAVLAGSALVMVNYVGQAVGAAAALIRNRPPASTPAQPAH
ncbi:MAG TPA: TRAP transporter small permease [Xanthobacteraceae bacterium]|nr:TRAP transporter small permease [Xanthobacteraceae bacterium]